MLRLPCDLLLLMNSLVHQGAQLYALKGLINYTATD